METYGDFVAGYIKATRSLDIIYFDTRPRETPSLPCWVPDWNTSFGAEHLIPDQTVSIFTEVPLLQKELVKNAQKEEEEIAAFDFDGPSRLMVSCCFFDSVDGVSKAGEVGWQGAEAVRSMSQSEDATFNVVWRTPLANKGFEDGELLPTAGGILAASTTPAKVANPKSGPRFTSCWENVKDLAVGDKIVEEWMRWGRESRPAPPFTLEEQFEAESSFVDIWYFRHFVTTTRGYTGVVSCETGPGDWVCVLKGSKLPVILRRVKMGGEDETSDASSGYWTLVGHGYVCGIVEEAQN